MSRLRTLRGMSRARLALLANTTEMSLLRIEKQGQEPSSGLFIRLMSTLGGSWDVASKLETISDEDIEAVHKIVADELAPLPVETPQEESRMDRLLRLLADGLSPQEAARRTLHQP